MAVTKAGEKLEKEWHIYSTDTIISVHTNRPIDGSPESVSPTLTFWCETCQLKLVAPTHAIQHLNGRSHKFKTNPRVVGINIDTLKRKHIALGGVVQTDGTTTTPEPDIKKTKIQPAEQQPIRCNDCDLQFTSESIAAQHFKGKKHASAVSSKLTDGKKGKFCQDCNITLNSEEQIKQHYNGNKHKIKAGIITPNFPPPGSYNQNGNPRGRGQMRGGRGDNPGRARGRGSTRGGGRGRGWGGENSTNRGRGGQRGGQRGGYRGGNRGGNRGGGGGVTTGGQYGGPPPYDGSSVNMQPIGGNRASVPGAKGRLNDYFVHPSTSAPDHFHMKPKAEDSFEQRNGYYDNMRNDYYENEAAAMNDKYGINIAHPPQQQKDYYGGMPPPPKDYYGGMAPSPGGPGGAPRDMYNPPAPPAQPNDLYSGGNGNYNEGYHANDGYRMNTDATYDSFYV